MNNKGEHNMSLLRVGDKVMCRNKIVKVIKIEYCPDGGKYGEDVKKIPWEVIDNCIVDLDDNHWAYGEQIRKIK
jgi:hypothetical protein